MGDDAIKAPTVADFSAVIYRDIAFADAKAGFAMTIAAVGVTCAGWIFGSMSGPNRKAALADPFVLFFIIGGILISFTAMLCAVTTVLPRKYIGKKPQADPTENGKDVIRLLASLGDLWQVVLDNLPFIAREDKAVSCCIEIQNGIIAQNNPSANNRPLPDMMQAWIAETGRQIQIRERKYWWVGPSILFAYLGVVFIVVGTALAVRTEAPLMTSSVKKIVCGGQTGADRGALNFALGAGIEYGGWVPKGRTDELGKIPSRYSQLVESDSPDPDVRTGWNVRDSDGTVIISNGHLKGGSNLTARAAIEFRKPYLHLDLGDISESDAAELLSLWLQKHAIATLNVAGPRECDEKGVGTQTENVLKLAIPDAHLH